MKLSQFISSVFFGFIGLLMIRHFWGDFSLAGVVSLLFGFGLAGIGVLSGIMFFRRRPFLRHNSDKEK